MLRQLNQLLGQANITITEQQKQQLLQYVALLHKWNKAYNLTSIRDPQQMLIRHIIDSLVVEPHLIGHSFIDVGTGPGLPGIPLAIIRADAQFTLLDSLGKRIRFLKQVQHELGLKNVIAAQSRVEAFTEHSGFDGVISRAFASLSDMLVWCQQLPNKNGRFFALKGIYPTDEIDRLTDNWHIEQIVRLKVPQLNEERHLVIIQPA